MRETLDYKFAESYLLLEKPRVAFFASRLMNLVTLRGQIREHISWSPDKKYIPLVDHAIYSVCSDLVRLGAAERANEILKINRRPIQFRSKY